jgi:aspartyl-tRNA(Asn)/glutamyl-tRNA(Gln) amidotransferase subunit A
MMNEACNMERQSIQEALSGMARAEKSAVALTEECLSTIEQNNPVVNAFLSVDHEGALARAGLVDEAIAARSSLGPLAGVPVGIKDVLTVGGLPATAGSKILEGYRPPYTATTVRKLIDAGAVILGKLNCDEFAMGSSNENSAYGPVRNCDPGNGYRRIDPPAGFVLRCGGCAADVWEGIALRADRLRLLSRPDRPIRGVGA